MKLKKEIGKYLLSIEEQTIISSGEPVKIISSEIKKTDSNQIMFKESENYFETFSKIKEEFEIFDFLKKYT